MNIESVPLEKTSDELLSDIYNKKSGEIINNQKITAERKLELIDSEIKDLNWYINIREGFETGDPENVNDASGEIESDPELFDKLIKEYGWIKGQTNFKFTLVEIGMLLEQMTALRKFVDKSHIKSNPESYAA